MFESHLFFSVIKFGVNPLTVFFLLDFPCRRSLLLGSYWGIRSDEARDCHCCLTGRAGGPVLDTQHTLRAGRVEEYGFCIVFGVLLGQGGGKAQKAGRDSHPLVASWVLKPLSGTGHRSSGSSSSLSTFLRFYACLVGKNLGLMLVLKRYERNACFTMGLGS